MHSKYRTLFYRYLASLSLLGKYKNWFTDETICNPTCYQGIFPIICKAYTHEKHIKTHKSTWKTYKATMFINYAHRIQSFISLPFPAFLCMILNGIPNFLLFILFQTNPKHISTSFFLKNKTKTKKTTAFLPVLHISKILPRIIPT